MKTPKVLAAGEFEDIGDFESASGRYPPTTLEGSPTPPLSFIAVWITPSYEDLLALLESLAGGVPTAALMPLQFLDLINRTRARGATTRALREASRTFGPPEASESYYSLEPLSGRRGLSVQAAGQPGDAYDVARRMAIQTPAVPMDAYSPIPSDNPAHDLRDWTGLTVQELAKMCHVTPRRFQHWLEGAGISSNNEAHLLRLRYLAGIVTAALGPSGSRRWFRAPQPDLGTTPIEAVAQRNEDLVQRLVERYLESPAT